MKLLADSSAFAKRYILEAGSESMDQLLQNASELALSALLVPEVISALNRRLRENLLPPRDYRKIKRRLMADVHDAVVIQITPAIISHSVKLLERHALRAMDALHVACALEWGAALFVTADRRQVTAAQHAGLHTQYIGSQDP